MSPSNINSFVGDLVQMAQAVEQLPKVEQELEQTKSKLDDALGTVQARELAIIDYKSMIDDLHAKVRSLEVERDDASFRVLEAEDKAHSALSCARDAKTCLELAIADLDPPKPEPVKEPEPQNVRFDSPEASKELGKYFEPQAQPVATPAEGQSVTDPTIHGTAVSSNSQDQTSVNDTVTQSENASTSTTIPDAVHSISETGQSEANPTNQDASGSVSEGSQSATTATASDTAVVDHGPYYGKRYDDMPTYISYHDWITGGGTNADYYRRPSRDRSF